MLMSQDEKTEGSIELDLDNLAPISVSVYTRLEHFRQCIESLMANTLARHSTLYVFSDAAQPGDEGSVCKVREFAKSITGFKKIVLVFQEENDYLRNMQDAREVPIKTHGKIIRMEDDNIVSPLFLEFMNSGLQYYHDSPEILSISGYSPPLNKSKYVNDDVYMSQIFSAWGFGIWAHKPVLEFLANEKPYADMVNCNLVHKVNSLHPKLSHALRRMDNGEHYAGDQKLTYFMTKHDLYQIKPVDSLVQNICHDGTGMHCGDSDRYDQPPIRHRLDVRLVNKQYNSKLDKLEYRFAYRRKIFSRLSNRIKKVLREIIK